MTYVITSPCVGTCDTACVDVCPCEAIHGAIPLEEIRAVPLEERAARFPKSQLFIDPDECIDCGACIPECPVEAIYEDHSVPEKYEADIERNAQFFLNRALGS
jgi:ferredoxin